MTKMSVLQQDITVLNVYIPNNRALNYRMHNWQNYKNKNKNKTQMTELQGKIESNYHSQRLQYLSHIFSKWTNPNLDMVQLNSCYLSTTVEQTFSSSQGAFTKLDHIPDYKTHINKCKRLEIIPCMLTTIKLN